MAPLALSPGLADWLRASCPYQPLAASTVLQLARRIQRWQQWPGGPGAAPAAVAKSGSRARDHLVRHNLRLIVHTWGRMALPGAPSADAFQEAAIQLQRAAERFDPCRGITFATYATPWLRAAFLAHHTATMRGLKLQLELAQLEDPQLEAAHQPSVEAGLGAGAVRELLALLTPQERHVIRYRYLRTKPLNTRQIARRLALGQGCLADLEHRALAKMQQHLLVARTAKAAGGVIF
jgi:RNA polymerase sigma factor (sigma-70 family)